MSEPLLMDRTELERYGTCPQSAYLHRIHKYPCNNDLAVGGVEIHRLIENAFSKNAILNEDGSIAGYELDKVAEYFVDELPAIRPDLQPDAIRAARFVADQIADIHTQILGVEKQIDYTVLPETASRPRVVATMCLDLLFAGKNNSLHYLDWKTGFRKRTAEEARDCFQTTMAAYLLFKNYDGSNTNADGQVLPRIQKVHVWYKEVRWGTQAYCCLDRDEEDPVLPHLTVERALEARVEQAVKMWMTDCSDPWPEPKKCSWCSAIYDCKYADPSVRSIAENPKEYVDRYAVICALAERMKDSLGLWFKQHGPVEGTETKFDWIVPEPKFSPKLIPLVADKNPIQDEEIAKHFKRKGKR